MDRSLHKCLLQLCTIFIALSGLSHCLRICSAAPSAETDISKTEPALLIVSYDAFRPEYFRRGVTPYMNRFRKEGTSAAFVYNVFPTKTFPNHHTMATGFYPKTHGITGNTLYDTKLGDLGYSYELYHYNESIWPIWTANEKAGKNSGCMMWPGSNFKYDDTACTFSQNFNETMSWNERVDIVMTWFTNEKTPANLVMMYIEEPDVHAHIYSPDSNVTTKLVSQLDDLTKYIQQKLVENNLDQRVNVIHVSDHGMSSVSPPNFINLTNFVRNETVSYYGSSPVLQIVPKDINLLNEIRTNLTRGAIENGHFKVFTPENLPDRWNASNARRFGPLVAVADMDYAFQDMFASAEWYWKEYGVPITPTTKYGVHGYDNAEKLMHAIFMAKGPLFAHGQELEPFNTVDLYNLFCRILRIECKPNEGTDRTHTWDVLLGKSSNAVPPRPRPHDVERKPAILLVAAIIAVIALLFAIMATIFEHLKGANAKNKPVRLSVSDELDSELLLQSNPDV